MPIRMGKQHSKTVVSEVVLYILRKAVSVSSEIIAKPEVDHL
jgi:hypothetical protein